jgi:hypothetical protein
MTGFPVSSTTATKRFAGFGVFYGALLFEFAIFFNKHFNGDAGYGNAD